MRRKRFDHLFEELSMRIGRLAPRYALWLRLGELGLDPEHLRRDAVVQFCREHLDGFLREHGIFLAPRDLDALARAVERHDPSVRDAAEWLASW